MKHLLITIVAVLWVGCVMNQSPKNPRTRAPIISIHSAAHQGSIEAVKQHLAAGTDVNAKNKAGATSLSVTVGKGHKEIGELLIAKGAYVNAKEALWGWTPLHYAARSGVKEIIELLIAAGADVNAKNENVFTPLHSSAMHDHKEIAELLIAKGADVNSKNAQGWTPLDLATVPGSPFEITQTADLLRKHGGKTSEELKAAGN